jgi:hypothetical protein
MSTQPISRDPLSAEEWQEAIDSAQFLLLLRSAKIFGLICGGPSIDSIDEDRCWRLIRLGAAAGYKPASDGELVKKFMPEKARGNT